ncbi:MAG: acyl-CoA dehydrogenase C-terminal domain-containing protein, partial [Burkholderiales bacterium]
DLVTRKLSLSDGAAVKHHIGELRKTVAAVNAANDPAFGETGACLGEAVDSLERTTTWLLRAPQGEAALAGATPYLRLFGTASGGALLAEQALAAVRLAGDDSVAARIALARFFAENIAVGAQGLERTVIEGGESVNASEAALA